MAYWSPDDSSGNREDPRYRDRQAPPLPHEQSSGTFKCVMTQSAWIESGNTARFQFVANHVKDGAIQPAALALAMQDRYGNAYTLGVTVNTVTLLSGSQNTYYSDVEFSTSVSAGDYIAVWTGTYTPIGTATALAIAMKWPFKIRQTLAPSSLYFWKTSTAANA